jgi:[histone H3]-lysine27 N-trimethyltransferase EZH2
VATEVASRGTDGGNTLSQRVVERQCRSDLANRTWETDMISMQENMSARTLTLSSSAQRTIVRFVKLPLVDKIPLHTAWISLEKYG